MQRAGDFSSLCSSIQKTAVTGTISSCNIVNSAGWHQIRGRMGCAVCPLLLKIKERVIINKTLPEGFLFLFVCQGNPSL